MYNWIEDLKLIKQSNASSAELEKAFIDMSYNAVAAKAGRLMEDNYRIGAEIVYSNDDSSKMAGMYAFKIGKNLISVPAIFTNGTIKGVELMYEHKVKLMRPLDPAWVEHIINKTELKEGASIAMEKADGLPQNPRLNVIVNPQGMFKNSSNESAVKAWEEVFASIETSLEAPESHLKNLVKTAPEFVMEKLAKAMDLSLDFAEAIAWVDEDTLFPQIEKKASEQPKPDIEIIFEPNMEKMAKEDLKEFSQKGYQLWDMRPQDELNYVTGSLEEVYEEVKSNGEYTVITDSGDEVKVIIGVPSSELNTVGAAYNSKDYLDPKAIYFPDEKKFITNFRFEGLVGIVDREKETDGSYLKDKMKEEVEGKENVSVGSSYVAYNKDTNVFSDPFKVNKLVKNKDNITVYDISSRYNERQLIINSDITTDEYPTWESKKMLLGCNNIFLPLTANKEKEDKDCCSPCDSYDNYEYKGDPLLKADRLLNYLKSTGVKKISVKADEDIEECKVYENEKPVFESQGSMLMGQTKIAGFYNISFEDAGEIIKQASRQYSKDFYLVPNGGFNKKAAVYFSDRPNFQKDYDSSVSVATDPEQTHVSESERTVLNRPTLNLGYGMNLNEGVQNGMVSEEAGKKGITDYDLTTKSPEELTQLASTNRVSNLFEHGLVGSLVTTYDSAALIENYIPHLEKGLDHFGRILFLLYWKPADFEKLYGSDDMPLLENKLKSQFKSMGDLVLDLIKKNEKVKGTVATP